MIQRMSPGLFQSWPSTWAAVCEEVAALVHDDPSPVLDRDLLVIDSSAHARHLAQRLAGRGDGPQISAGFEVLTWGGLRHRLMDSPPADSWQGEGLQLAVIAAVRASTDPRTRFLRAHLGQDRPGRAAHLGRRIARLMTGYLHSLPEMVSGWSAGANRGPDGEPLGDRDAWQPVLWRDLVALTGRDPSRIPQKLPGATQLPARVIAVAMDEPRGDDLALLTRLATDHRVHLLNHRPVGAGTGNPLVRWLNHRTESPGPVPVPGYDSWLHRVQTSIRSNVAVVAGTRDDTIQIHASHGPARQVEVLREVLTGMFSDDPTLQPRDVVVLCCDLARYAPLISAAFNPVGDLRVHPGQGLRIHVATRTVPRFNPITAVLGLLFDLHHGRATGDDLLDLCRQPPVAAMFGFGADELDRLTHLIAESQIRWGIDLAHRLRNGVAVPSSTWMSGLERMLISIAVTNSPPVMLRTTTPLPHFDESDINLVGSLAELISRVRRILAEFAMPADATTWAARLTGAVDTLTQVDFDTQWQRQEVLGRITDLAVHGTTRSVLLDSWDLAAVCAGWQVDARGRANDANGSLLVTALDDLVGIDHRVVCLLGLDDDCFPGSLLVDGDDLLDRPGGHRPWTDDPRSRRHQHLLDAVLAAESRLVIITRGADEHTGRTLPMPVCVGALLDGFDPSPHPRDWGPDRDDAVRWHPIHAHARSCFQAPTPTSFDHKALGGARALLDPPAARVNRAAGTHLVSGQAAATATEVSLRELATFFTDPARELMRLATGTTWSGYDDTLPQELPIAPDARESWAVGAEIYRMILDGADPARAAQAAWLSGRVLPGARGHSVVMDQMEQAAQVAAAVRRASGERQLVDCELSLDGVRIAGAVPLQDGAVVVSRFGHLKPDDALAGWLQLCLVSACHGCEIVRGALLIGKRPQVMTTPDPEQARVILTGLLRLRAQGLSQVLPLPLRTAAAYAQVLSFQRGQAADRARVAYGAENENWLYFFPTFDSLTTARATRHDPLPVGGALGSRFETLAMWLMHPIKLALHPGRHL